jgi:polar amino acid transport system ATP-binding protein
VTPVPDTFVCNLGDMLEKLTGGQYRSTPHRVRRPTSDRISMPYFFDPGWDARVEPLRDGPGADPERWDRADPHLFEGTYGDYVWSKVGKVFPGLR